MIGVVDQVSKKIALGYAAELSACSIAKQTVQLLPSFPLRFQRVDLLQQIAALPAADGIIGNLPVDGSRRQIVGFGFGFDQGNFFGQRAVATVRLPSFTRTVVFSEGSDLAVVTSTVSRRVSISGTMFSEAI